MTLTFRNKCEARDGWPMYDVYDDDQRVGHVWHRSEREWFYGVGPRGPERVVAGPYRTRHDAGLSALFEYGRRKRESGA